MANPMLRRLGPAGSDITGEERKVRRAEHSQRWIANAMRTERIDHAECTAAIRDLYTAAGLEWPRVVIVPSPRILAFASGFSCAFWYLHDHAQVDFDAACDVGAVFSDLTSSAIFHATCSAFTAATRNAVHTPQRTRFSAPVILGSYVDFDPVVHLPTNPATDEATDGAVCAAIARVSCRDTVKRGGLARKTLETIYMDAYQAIGPVRLAVRYGVDAITRGATEDDMAKFGDIAIALLGRQHASFGMNCAKVWRRCYQPGNLRSEMACSGTADRDILGLEPTRDPGSTAAERCAKAGGFRFVHARFCMVSDFAEVLRVDERGRPHCVDGPSLRWRDGWELYHLHGVRVPRQIVMEPGKLTVAQIDGQRNLEVRRVMIERFGAGRYMRESGARLQHQDHRGRLWSKERPGETPYVMVEVRNSTPEPDGSFKDYWLRVPPGCKTATEAVAWTFGVSAKNYSPRVET
jgi:hypothetical protein